MFDKAKYFLCCILFLFSSSFAFAGAVGEIVAMGTLQKLEATKVGCEIVRGSLLTVWCNNKTIKVIEYAMYDNSGRIIYFDDKNFVLSVTNNVHTLSVKLPITSVNGGDVVMQGGYQSSSINPACEWVVDSTDKTLRCGSKEVIKYAEYDKSGRVVTFNDKEFLLSVANGTSTIFYKFPALEPVLFAGSAVMIGSYEANSISPKCSWLHNTPFKSLICGGVKAIEYAVYDRPGTVSYFNAKDFVLGSTNNVQTIFYKSPFSDTHKDPTLAGTFEIFTNDTVLDKPVIMVESYDPTNSATPYMIYNDRWADVEECGIPKKKQLLGTGMKKLVYGGRDLIIVNFPDGSAKLDANAVLLQRIIQEVNARKVGVHPTAIIGHSMGGILAKKALKNMELAGIDHQTSLYISYDAPHLGANSPLALQETISLISDTLSDDYYGLSLKSLRVAGYYSNSDAAKEMLISGPDYDPTKVTNASFPSRLARVAVTSGSMMGMQQNPADQQAPREKIVCNTPTPGPAFVEGQEVAFFKLYSLGLPIHWVAKPIVEQKSGKSFYWDNVPGSFEFQYDLALKALYETRLDMYIPLEAKHPIAFTATTSALAIKGDPNVAARDSFKYYSPFDKYIAIDAGADPYVPQNDGVNSMVAGCANYNSQSLSGANGHHVIFYPSQLSQLVCALNEFHKIGATIPDRSFKNL